MIISYMHSLYYFLLIVVKFKYQYITTTSQIKPTMNMADSAFGKIP